LASAGLATCPPLQAPENFSAALKRFATARGKSQLSARRCQVHVVFHKQVQ
jgi:hypothetical protein